MSWKISVSIAGGILLAGLAGFTWGSPIGKPEFQTGVQMGYSYGQNGIGYPSFGKDPLSNPGRGGFYLAQLRLKGGIAFDSTFSAVAVGNLSTASLQEIYLEKHVANYIFTAGKFRGAGVKSGPGTDEFDRITINAPLYARGWAYYKRLGDSRDLGLQVEADYLGGAMKHKFFFHNANRENILSGEPNYYAGPAAQAVGFDYSLDWRISPFTVWGGHMGAMADHEWSEFTGKNGGFNPADWFRANPIVDASLNHQLDVGRFHMFNEALLLFNRTIPNPVDSGTTKTWGVSTQVGFDHSRRLGSFFRYEFCDPSDGAFGPDNTHLITLGVLVRPSPAAFPGLKITTEYVRTMEDGFLNTQPNDVIFCQLQMLF